ncbi:MAG: hypothetical protein AAGJ81_08250 [Verrucomicrobiota bacterium]
MTVFVILFLFVAPAVGLGLSLNEFLNRRMQSRLKEWEAREAAFLGEVV